MKMFRIAGALIFLLSAASLLGQVDWTAEGNQWTYGSIVRDTIFYPNQLYIGADTVIDGVTATSVLQLNKKRFAAYSFYYTDSPKIDTFFIYQSGDSLLYYVDSAFQVLYDFSLSVGDTMQMYAPRAFRDFRLADQEFDAYRVDSVSNLVVGQTTLRGQYLRRIPPHHFIEGAFVQGWRYELLGMLNGYFFPYDGFQCDGQCPYFLRCFSGDGEDSVEYKRVDYACDSVLVITSIREPDISSSLRAYPNPLAAGQDLVIEWMDQDVPRDLQIHLYDPLGREVRTTSFTNQNRMLRVLSNTDLSMGIYTLVIRSSHGRAVKRVVVSSGP